MTSLIPAHKETEGFQISPRSTRNDCRKQKLVSKRFFVKKRSR